MDISSLGITGVAAITVICLLIGQGRESVLSGQQVHPHHLRRLRRCAGCGRYVPHA